MNPADYAWMALAAAVLGYEITAANRRDWDLLSEAADRYRGGHPVMTHLVVFYVAAHLTRLVPRRIDPLHRMARKLAS